MKLPLYCRKDSSERGRHLVASVPLVQNQLIFVERPLVSLQSLDNIHTNLLCRYCRASCGDSNTRWGLASGRLKRQDLITHSHHGLVVCRQECGEVYCSRECEVDSWKAGHALLCTGSISNEQHPLIQFKLYAMHHNEIFLMVADAVVGMLLSEEFRNKMLDFSQTPWWTVATTAPLLESDATKAEAAELDATLRRLCLESSSLLKQALLRYVQQDEKSISMALIEELCSAESFGYIIGSFEQNAIGIRLRNPLCREIFEKHSRQVYQEDLVLCLQKAGMIGTSASDHDEESEEDNCASGHDCCKHKETVADDTDVYSEDEIAQFLAGLDLDEQSDDNDLDQVMPPLDGTAMYATACKMNHSCDPNVAVLYKQCGDGMPLVAYCVALRDVEEGEELCISYIDSDKPLSVRQEALANYGFSCKCGKCIREGLEDKDKNALSNKQEEVDEEDLFGPDDDDSEHEDGEETNIANEGDGDSMLQARLEELDQTLNKAATNTIPVNVLAVACNYVIRVGAVAVDALPNDLQLMMQDCLGAVRNRDFVQCCKSGSRMEESFFHMLLENGAWPDIFHRHAYGCGALACSIGNLHVGSLLEAQALLDKAFILGLPRDEIADFFSLVEYFAHQTARGPFRPVVGCKVESEIDAESLDPLAFPIPETSPDITLEAFDSQYVSTATAVVFQGFASNWIATTKWRDLNTLVWDHGHRLIPIELGTMMKSGGMTEQMMPFRSFVATYLAPSSQKSLWTLTDATSETSSVAYLAQHPLLDQIPVLCNDIVMSPRLCSSPPSHRNVWMGTGGTRTPLHHDSFDNFLVQIVGHKYVRVYETAETDNLYVIRGGNLCDVAAQGNMSAVNCELEDFEEHPLARNANFQEIYLGPGDCLFIPARMWHYVRSMSTSISVNYWWC